MNKSSLVSWYEHLISLFFQLSPADCERGNEMQKCYQHYSHNFTLGQLLFLFHLMKQSLAFSIVIAKLHEVVDRFYVLITQAIKEQLIATSVMTAFITYKNKKVPRFVEF